jgi:hypothetical protein
MSMICERASVVFGGVVRGFVVEPPAAPVVMTRAKIRESKSMIFSFV